MDEVKKLMLRHYVRAEFTGRLLKTCNMKSRMCRGGSRDLYALLISDKGLSQYLDLLNSLEIVSGMGHTFIRYNDGQRYLYIDPTIAQFYPAFDGIFVGDEDDLKNIVAIQKNLKGYKLDINDYL